MLIKSVKKSFSKKLKVLKSPIKGCDKRGGCYNNFSEKMGVYVINCKVHVERYSKFKKYAKKAGIKACRVPCVLGKKFSTKCLCKMVRDGILSKKADMTKIEVSINMSHYNAWQKFLNSCDDYALIFEDDVEVKKNFIDMIDLIMKTLKENKVSFSLLHLYNGNWMRTKSDLKKIVKVNDKITIMKETMNYNAAASAYIISKKYAEFLTNPKVFFPIKIPQDILMGDYVNKGNHLTLNMKFDKKKDCYISPVLGLPCGGPGGTGKQTTQESSPSIKEILKDI